MNKHNKLILENIDLKSTAISLLKTQENTLLYIIDIKNLNTFENQVMSHREMLEICSNFYNKFKGNFKNNQSEYNNNYLKQPENQMHDKNSNAESLYS